MKRPVPLKGHPDFSFLSDKKLKEYEETINAMIVCYSDFPDKVEMKKNMWKDLKDEYAERLSLSPDVTKKSIKHLSRNILRKSKIGT